MRIFINALSARRGGAINYVKYLLEHYPDASPSEIIIAVPESFEMPDSQKKFQRLRLPRIVYKNPLFRRIWEIFILPTFLINQEIDILFCPGGLFGGRVPKNCKLVTTFQNMMPFDINQRVKYPLGYMRLRNWILEKQLLKSMLNSELVIFISDYAKSFIEKKTKNSIINSVVIPHGVDSIFIKDQKKKLPIPSDFPQNYLLYISTIEFYKAQIEVIEAYAILKNKLINIPKLILMGPEYKPYAKLVRKSIVDNELQNDVFLKSAIPNIDLPALYQNATINIFASMTENCPLILLEALAAGRPLAVSNYPPMPEFGSDAVEYFNPSIPEELATLLSKILENNDLSDKLSQKALERSRAFDWRVTAKKTWDSINSL
tara:strand:+ start:786 stop:1910 length:1125 start_codon:yes stop_codon:yes gene_type:complete